jgi:hypothetical protein
MKPDRSTLLPLLLWNLISQLVEPILKEMQEARISTAEEFLAQGRRKATR